LQSEPSHRRRGLLRGLGIDVYNGDRCAFRG
jgi:hypothetical protein